MAREAFYVKILVGGQVMTVTAGSLEDAESILGIMKSAMLSGAPVDIRGRAIRGHSGREMTALALNPAMISGVGIEVYVPGVREW